MKKKSKYASVQLSLPRFEQNTELEMVDFFKQLGVTKIFKEHNQLNNMVITKPTKQFFIDKIIHKAVIKVDETGTEDEVPVRVVVEQGSIIIPAKESVVFRANHTFRYFIESTPGIILFSGQYDGQ